MSSLDQERFWRSIADLEGTPEFEEFLGREFPEQAEMLSSPLSRRRFMQLMGASMALSGVTGCRWEEDKIIPLSRRPEGHVPGIPKYYATGMEIGGNAIPLMATSYDGRPVQVGPNVVHPSGAAGTTPLSQASVLGLYDPDRSKKVRNKEGQASWGKAKEVLRGMVGKPGTAVLSEATSSPAAHALRAELEGKGVQWYEYEAISRDNERAGTAIAFGRPLRVHHNYFSRGRAKVVVSFDADLVGDHPDGLRLGKDLAAARGPAEPGMTKPKPMTRLYAIESVFSATGAFADHRLPVRPSQIKDLVFALEGYINAGTAPGADGTVGTFMNAVVEDLLKERRLSAVAVGYRQPPEVHAAVARINAKLGNGAVVTYSEVPDANRPTHAEAIAKLTQEMAAGKVKNLVILGGNPVFDAPAAFAAALGKVKDSVHLSPYVDETSAQTSWHIPRAHFLESWGDALTYDGSYTVTQPLIDPLYKDAQSTLDVLKVMAGRAEVSNRELVKASVAKLSPMAQFDRVVHAGFMPASRAAAVAPGVPNGGERGTAPTDAAHGEVSQGNIEVVLTPSSAVYDGRFANNAWLQELPDFMTKIVWENAAIMGPQTANVLGVKDNDVVKVDAGGASVELPAYILPGMAPATVQIALGYGRTHAGQIGGLASDNIDSLGANAYPLRKGGAWHIGKASVQNTGKKAPVATTQNHWAIDAIGKKTTEKRAHSSLVFRATQDEYTKDPTFFTKKAELKEVVPLMKAKTQLDPKHKTSLYEEHSYDGYKWGMAIDLSKCIGCNSCVVACQSENNIPVVGKEQVMKKREMHWIRVDRYFVGDPNNPEVAHQPVACQHCENAPCEQVCPVGATVHSDEGLNDMAYNRCVGTRYCLNNCPYKVRRFNYHYYWKQLDEPKNASRKLQFNPEVTVRSRGVMEKCSFCVQRIQNAKIPARNDGRKLADREVQTACQQACPTDAILFGDLNSESMVKKAHDTPRAYAMLSELNVKPRNAYLAKITNPNPSLVKKDDSDKGGH